MSAVQQDDTLREKVQALLLDQGGLTERRPGQSVEVRCTYKLEKNSFGHVKGAKLVRIGFNIELYAGERSIQLWTEGDPDTPVVELMKAWPYFNEQDRQGFFEIIMFLLLNPPADEGEPFKLQVLDDGFDGNLNEYQYQRQFYVALVYYRGNIEYDPFESVCPDCGQAWE